MKNDCAMKYMGLAGCLLISIMLMVSCQKKNNGNPVASAGGITPDSAAGGGVLTLTGSGLANIKSIMFSNDSVPAPFNTNFNTDNAIIFRVPDTAVGGKQNIIFTNYSGKTLVVPFNVVALPTVTTASLYEFVPGTQITLNGNNLDNVTAVVLHGTTTAATIVSQTRSTMVITMPATTLTRAQLDITNASGTITTSSNQQFAAIDNAYVFFADDNYGTGVGDWSWDGSSVGTGTAILGDSSLKEVYSSGSWAALSFHAPSPVVANNYTYCSFWIFGGTASEQIDVSSEDGGSTVTETIPPGVWTFYTIPISGWIGGVSVNRLDFKMHGPAATEIVYVDDVMFVK